MILALGDYRNCFEVKKSLKHMCLWMQNLNPCLLILNLRQSEPSGGDLFISSLFYTSSQKSI